MLVISVLYYQVLYVCTAKSGLGVLDQMSSIGMKLSYNKSYIAHTKKVVFFVLNLFEDYFISLTWL